MAPLVTSGTWGVFPFTIPDWGVTEWITEKTGIGAGNPNWVNPNRPTTPVLQDSGLSLDMMSYNPNPTLSSNRSTGQPTGQTTGQPTGQPTGGQPTGQPTGGQPTGGNQPTVDPQEEVRRQAEAIYAPIMSYLSEAENTLRSNFESQRSLIEQEYQNALSSLGVQKTQSLRDLSTQEEQARQRKEDALSAARRLYSELGQGIQQRFGGASSAGQAASELLGREQLKQQGGIWRAFQNAVSQIENYRARLNENYDQAINDVNLQKAQAIQQIQSDYNAKLAQIGALRGQTESAKANLKLQLLNDLKDKVWQINIASLNYLQQLAANKQISNQILDSYTQRFAQSVLGGGTAVQNLFGSTTVNPSTNLAFGGGQASTTPLQTGQISPTKKREEDIFDWAF
ncbi:MAG: hypothetical protein KatS3mg101_0977 [Patescibacteria group bacterium]|nr:MAG: hypothetical protein KatS3mg101_0977 [Patescibacteria group bacterium]